MNLQRVDGAGPAPQPGGLTSVHARQRRDAEEPDA